MAANINGTFDFTPIALKVVDSTYGAVFFSVVVVLIVSGYVLSMLLKSGIITSFAAYSEHRREQRNKQITEQEQLLKDEFLKEYSCELVYHIKASKLSNYLNVKNKDLDLLTYILSCRNKERAVRLYKIGQDYLEKDFQSGTYKLKQKYTELRIKIHSGLGTCLYVFINLIGASPFIYLNYLKVKYRHETFTIPDSLYSSLLFFFIAFFIVSLMVLWKFMRPTAAKNFLEMEKIVIDQSKKDTLNKVA